MKMIKRAICLCLSMLLCMSFISVGAFAAKLDYTDGYLEVTDSEGKPFGGLLEVGEETEYHLILNIFDEDSDRYVQEEILPTDTVRIYLVDEITENETVVGSATGSVVRWTVSKAGYNEIRIELTRGENSYDAYEAYWVGKQRSMEYVALEYNGAMGNDGILYTGKSIKNDFRLWFPFTEEYLVEGVDYKLKLSLPKGPGNGTIVATGMGDYTGQLQEEYTIINPSARFSDVKKNGWYVGAVNFALESELFNGTTPTTFSPDNPMTRGMFVTVICRFLGLDEQMISPETAFFDVSPSMYYAEPVAWANALGIVNGVTPTRFEPNSPITREQMCAILLRVNGVLNQSFAMLEIEVDFTMREGGKKFADHKQISPYAKTAVYACRNEGVVNGRPNNIFDPKGKATRAEVATIMFNYSKYVAKCML